MARASRPARAAASALLVAAVTLVGCSNTSPSINRRAHPGSATASVADGLQTVRVTAGDTYRFDPSTIAVHPGRVKIVLDNTGGGAPHDWSLLGIPAATTQLAGGGVSVSVTFTAPARGTYEFVCTVHQKQGMTGKLVVLPR